MPQLSTHRFTTKINCRWLTSLLLLILSFSCIPAYGLPDSRPKTSIQSAFDLSGQPVNPFTKTNAATVLIFVAVDCPVSNKYAPEIQRLMALFERRNIHFWIVYPDAETDARQIREHAREYSLGKNILRDPAHVLVKKSQATITPEAAIFDQNNRLVYHGRIDDRFVALGTERTQATSKDLEQNLNLLLSGKPIPEKQTKSIGCHISALK